jgi:hypothetical protein
MRAPRYVFAFPRIWQGTSIRSMRLTSLPTSTTQRTGQKEHAPRRPQLLVHNRSFVSGCRSAESVRAHSPWPLQLHMTRRGSHSNTPHSPDWVQFLMRGPRSPLLSLGRSRSRSTPPAYAWRSCTIRSMLTMTRSTTSWSAYARPPSASASTPARSSRGRPPQLSRSKYGRCRERLGGNVANHIHIKVKD